MNRRAFLLNSARASAALLAAPTATAWLTDSSAAAATDALKPLKSAVLPFVDHYVTNTTTNLTASTNAAVEILAGMARLWKTGTAWNNGAARMPDVLRANVRHSVQVTRHRTEAQAKDAFIHDRQDQSYGVIAGLGPLADLYKSGAKAVTSITSAPDGTPPTLVNEGVPAGAPAGSATGAGSVDSDLGLVVQLVQALRGPSASGNPAKLAYQYPRPWRLTDDSKVVDTGRIDEFGFPVYKSNVLVAPQLLRQRGTRAPDDGGFPSGHTNAFHLAGLALAYALPERFQELVAHASFLSDTRIVAGMHSAVDVIGGRTLGTALAAAALSDPRNATLKAAARSQASQYFQSVTGTTADTLFAFAHSAGRDTDPYADREVNERAVTPRLTYILPRRGREREMVVPKGAEVLLETRLPYLTATQRREVLRTTALPSGYVLLDGPELWGRLNLFAAGDGYGAFDSDLSVDMNAAEGGFSASDSWRNDITGHGGLTKTGSGSLTLSGSNRYDGGTMLRAGTLVAASRRALGRGGVRVSGGTLRVLSAEGADVDGSYIQSSGSTLEVTLGEKGGAALNVGLSAVLARGSALRIHLSRGFVPVGAKPLPVIHAHGLQGTFTSLTVEAEGYRAEPVYSFSGLSVRLSRH